MAKRPNDQSNDTNFSVCCVCWRSLSWIGFGFVFGSWLATKRSRTLKKPTVAASTQSVSEGVCVCLYVTPVSFGVTLNMVSLVLSGYSRTLRGARVRLRAAPVCLGGGSRHGFSRYFRVLPGTPRRACALVRESALVRAHRHRPSLECDFRGIHRPSLECDFRGNHVHHWNATSVASIVHHWNATSVASAVHH